MSSRFTQRGYKTKTVQDASRSELFKKKTRESPGQQVYFVTTYSSVANPIKRIIQSNWDLISSDPTLREVFPAPPKVSFKRAPTLRDRLVPSHLPADNKKTWLHRSPKGTYKCGFCNHCTNIKECKQFTDFKTQKMYDIKAFINCNTTFVDTLSLFNKKIKTANTSFQLEVL